MARFPPSDAHAGGAGRNNYDDKPKQVRREDMRVSAAKGEVVLRNVTLRPRALAALGLPLAIKRGRVDLIHVKVRVSSSIDRALEGRKDRSSRVETAVVRLFSNDPLVTAPTSGASSPRG